jgi:hypothetical protein
VTIDSIGLVTELQLSTLERLVAPADEQQQWWSSTAPAYLSITNAPSLQSLWLSGISNAVGASITLNNLPVLSTIAAPLLVSISELVLSNLPSLTSFTGNSGIDIPQQIWLDQLQTMDITTIAYWQPQGVALSYLPLINTVYAPKLTRGSFNFVQLSALTNITSPSLTYLERTTITNVCN